MVEVDLYCRRCNRRFSAEHASAPCPGCGGMSMAWRDAPTIVFADTQPIRYEATDPQTDELIETRLGNYWIESFLGEGGMVRVYRAEHLTLERPCAIKVLRPSIAAKDATSVETFPGRGSVRRRAGSSPRGDFAHDRQRAQSALHRNGVCGRPVAGPVARHGTQSLGG